MIIAVINYKAGTGKTTTAGWLAKAFAERGLPTVGVDADPAQHWREWADDIDGFGFPILPMASTQAHTDIPALAGSAERVVVDCPQHKDHPGFTGPVLKIADVALVPLMPSTSEIRRTMRMGAALDAVDAVRATPLQRLVLLNRTKPYAKSTRYARDGFRERGWPVAKVTVPDWEDYRLSIGDEISASGSHFNELITEQGWG
ncbi:nucleotide-binding protein [Streptomyces sp. NPDC002754]